MDLNTISIISSITSLVVSIGAVALAIIFYMSGRNTEIRVSTLLAEIKSQTEALQKLSGCDDFALNLTRRGCAALIAESSVARKLA